MHRDILFYAKLPFIQKKSTFYFMQIEKKTASQIHVLVTGMKSTYNSPG